MTVRLVEGPRWTTSGGCRPLKPRAVGRHSGTLAGVSADPKDRWHDLGAFIREQRGSARLSLRRLSELAGISNPYLSQIERGLRRPSAEILQQIAKALRISAETLYVQAGILEPPEASPDLTRAIMVDPGISEEHKQALVRIYLSFRREYEEERAARSAEQASTAQTTPEEASTAEPSPAAPAGGSPNPATVRVPAEASPEKDGRAEAPRRQSTRPSATASA
jgi:transcriptional regulator with XRE-family HTH domain